MRDTPATRVQPRRVPTHQIQPNELGAPPELIHDLHRFVLWAYGAQANHMSEGYKRVHG
jgi:hypothetical protein